MNRYGMLALRHFQQHRATEMDGIEDVTAHFTQVGDAIEAEVTRLRDDLLGSRRLGETLNSFRSRGRQAFQTAEEVVLRDRVFGEPDLEAEDDLEESGDPILADYYRTLREIGTGLSFLSENPA